MLEFAVGRKLMPANPAKGVRLFKGEKKERFLSEAEVARLGDTLATMEAERALSATAASAVRLLMLTGCRKSEIVSLRWEWLDLERGYLRLPDGKTGARLVPLAASAMELLSRLPPTSGYVLPAAKAGGHYTGLQKDCGSECASEQGFRDCAYTTCATPSRPSHWRTGTLSS